jgi:hypothetical protein
MGSLALDRMMDALDNKLDLDLDVQSFYLLDHLYNSILIPLVISLQN